MSQKHPLGVEIVTTLVPFIFESNPRDLILLTKGILNVLFMRKTCYQYLFRLKMLAEFSLIAWCRMENLYDFC